MAAILSARALGDDLPFELGKGMIWTFGKTRLVVNPKEAVRVRAIFALYLELGGLLPVVRELKRRRWRNKRWRTRHGEVRGADPSPKPICTGC